MATIKKMLMRLLRLYVSEVRLTVAEKLTVVFAGAVMLLILLVLGVFALAFLSGALVSALALVLPQWACYLICFGLFAVLMVIVLAMRRVLIIDPIARFVSRLVFDHDEASDSVCEK